MRDDLDQVICHHGRPFNCLECGNEYEAELEAPQAVPAVATPVSEGKADPSREREREASALVPAETGREDVPGFNPVQRESMTRAAEGVCDFFDPSHHGNAYIRTSGESVNCIRCNKPQWRHWIKQALSSSPVQPDPVTPSSVARGAGADVKASLLATCRAVLGHLDGSTGEIDAVEMLRAAIRLAASESQMGGAGLLAPVPLPDAAPSPTHTADGREIVRTIQVPAHTVRITRAVPQPYISDDEDAAPSASAQTVTPRPPDHRCPEISADTLHGAFVAGAKWWEFTSTHATMWPTDRDKAWEESEKRYGPLPSSAASREEQA